MEPLLRLKAGDHDRESSIRVNVVASSVAVSSSSSLSSPSSSSSGMVPATLVLPPLAREIAPGVGSLSNPRDIFLRARPADVASLVVAILLERQIVVHHPILPTLSRFLHALRSLLWPAQVAGNQRAWRVWAGWWMFDTCVRARVMYYCNTERPHVPPTH